MLKVSTSSSSQSSKYGSRQPFFRKTYQCTSPDTGSCVQMLFSVNLLLIPHPCLLYSFLIRQCFPYPSTKYCILLLANLIWHIDSLNQNYQIKTVNNFSQVPARDPHLLPFYVSSTLATAYWSSTLPSSIWHFNPSQSTGVQTLLYIWWPHTQLAIS